MSLGNVDVRTAGGPAVDAAPPAVEGLRDRGKRRRRERILESARDLLRDRPGHTFTIPELAERAEVSVPTIANLIGTRDAIWAALADGALGAVDHAALPDEDPRQRADAILAGMADVLISDPGVNRALIRGWSHSVSAMSADPTRELICCFTRAQRAGATLILGTPRRMGELLATGLVGCVHQWGAGLITDDTLRRRLTDLVAVAFASVEFPTQTAR